MTEQLKFGEITRAEAEKRAGLARLEKPDETADGC